MTDILITGGTGFFGNAFVERLLKTGEYERICIYSRDEYKQSLMRAKFDDHPSLRFFIGDVRDKDRLTRAMLGVDVVIHAAALKRIEVGAYNPDEMVKTNIIGTMNVIDAATYTDVGEVVFLSSDKAWQPASPYGQSKALAESLVLNANNMFHKTVFKVTRYGNVMGSTGSVIPTWREQIERTGKVTVTDPECTRFWMSAYEAVTLVLNAVNDGPEIKFDVRPGGITWVDNDDNQTRLFIPTLPAFKVGDLAKAMDAETIITGLSEFEKKHEGMCDGNTSDAAVMLSVDEIKERLKYV